MVPNTGKTDDFAALATWIQPQHLSVSGIDAHRADFESRTPRVLQITDFLQPDRAASLGRFLGQEATYEQVYWLYSAKDGYGEGVSADRWQAADEDSRYYTHGMLSDPDPRCRLSPNLITFLGFRQVLATSAFRAYLSAVTGLPLGEMEGGKVHQMRPGDFIKPHNDRGEGPGRRLAFVFYLSPTWKADYGGALHIIGKQDEHSRVEATFNSLVMFDLTTHKLHYVATIQGPVGDHSRLAVAGWLCSPNH